MQTLATTATWSSAADAVVAELLESGRVQQPPVDAIKLAERMRIVVAIDSGQCSRGRLKRLAGQSSIFLKPDDRPERLQWAAAHELGEVVAWQVFERAEQSADDAPPQLREDVANLVASRLLLPSRWFLDDARQCEVDLLQLKRTYRTASHELIAYRTLDLSDFAVISVFDNGRLVRRRSNFDGRPQRLQPLERDCWLQAHETNKRVELNRAGLAVVAWPIHESGWKREILRTTCVEDSFGEDFGD